MKAKNKSHALRQKRYRARKKWAADFDAERLEKLLIDPHEQKPFQDCQTPEQTLHTARVFAFAFRQKGVDCPDISADETIERFAYRVTRLWYSAPLGKILHFVSLKTFEFDADQGFTNALPLETFDSDWQPIPGSDITVDVASLAPIAPARAARAASPKKPECGGNGELCTDQTCLYFSWEIHWERQREIERKNIEKMNDLEYVKFQKELLEQSRLPAVRLGMIER
jgi:hypothetical protein